jgi:hypothetical protein
VFWRPDAYPRTVVLAPAPAHAERSLAYVPEAWPGRFIARDGDDGVHALLKAGDGEHRLWMPTPLAPGQAVACLVPLGGRTNASAAAALQFVRWLAGGPVAPHRPERRLQRVQQSLRAHDGHVRGASYREIAEQIFGVSRVAAECWRTSPLRDATIRLVRSGAALVRGDYKRLLRHGHDD